MQISLGFNYNKKPFFLLNAKNFSSIPSDFSSIFELKYDFLLKFDSHPNKFWCTHWFHWF